MATLAFILVATTIATLSAAVLVALGFATRAGGGAGEGATRLLAALPPEHLLGIAFLLGVAFGVSAVGTVVALRHREGAQLPGAAALSGPVVAVGAALSVPAVLVAAVAIGQGDLLRAAALIALLAIGAAAAAHALEALQSGDGLELRSHWGGLGGGLGGWQLSRAAVALLLAIGFAGAAIAVLPRQERPGGGSGIPATAPAPQPASQPVPQAAGSAAPGR